MAAFTIENISLRAVASIVPSLVKTNWDLDFLSDQEKKNLVTTTGIEKRRIAENETAADLCIRATEKIFSELNINKEEIDVLIFVSQTPDHLIPGSSMYIQNRLGLSNNCIAIDINQGCAGYVYGLSVIGSMMSIGKFKKGLLLVGDTITRTISKDDRSLVPIFSDAGSSTLLEFNSEVSSMYFNLQTDGAGYNKIIVEGGGARVDADEENKYLYMNGQDIFNFGLREVEVNVSKLLKENGIEKEKIDYFVMHQANMLLNETIRKKIGIPFENTLYSLRDYGNTSCVSIPLTLSANSTKLKKDSSILLAGFGVGLSWGSVFIRANNMQCFEIDEY
jgi:3-oxoacyl-[acyl-carrier-protein] synthase-3